MKVECYYGSSPHPTASIDVVDVLPEIGDMAYDGTYLRGYYQRSDDELYGYIDSIMSSQMSVPVGWYPMSTLVPAMGYDYGGKITSVNEATSAAFYALVTKKPHLYCYHNNGSAVEKAAIITNNNYEFDEETGTLTQHIIL
jgi:hypothetical protein